jgi:hypothetical protein
VRRNTRRGLFGGRMRDRPPVFIVAMLAGRAAG